MASNLGFLWQSALSKTGLSSSVSKSNVAINEVVESICAENKLKRSDNKGRHFRETSKWTFRVEELNTGEQATLEVFRGSLKNLWTSLKHKWLKGEQFQPFTWHCMREPDFHCFLYKSQGNVRDIVAARHLARGFPREQIIVGYLEDSLAALIELNYRGLYHSRLGWDMLEVGTDNRVRLAMLEYVVDEATARQTYRLSELRHAPPETLTSSMIGKLQRRRDLSRIQTWILGSLLLDILLHKQISGPDFHLAQTNLTSSAALRNIKANESKLTSVLWGSDLSKRMRTLVFQMLSVDPAHRIRLADALTHLDPKSEHRGQDPLDGTSLNSSYIRKRNRRHCYWFYYCCPCCSSSKKSSKAGNAYYKAGDSCEQNAMIVDPECDLIDMTMVPAECEHDEQGCVIHWAKADSSAARGRKVRITIQVDPKNEC